MQTEARRIFDDYIRSSGLKETAQRNYILDAFLNTERHVSVEDLYRILVNRKRKVGFVTVYRTMKLFADCGLARAVSFDDGVARFEPTLNRKHHHHLVCARCKKVIEFSSQALEKVEREILTNYRFEAHSHNYEIFGLCSDCRRKK